MKLYHFNPETKRVNICKAQFPTGNCRFGTDQPHFENREEAQQFVEKVLEDENGLFNIFSKKNGKGDDENNEKDQQTIFTKDELKQRLQLLSEDGLNSLILEQLKNGHSKAEAEEKLKNKEPFYVYYNRNQEITLDPEDYETQNTFMKGACSVLAHELHRATGWNIVVFSDKREKYWSGHVVVETPSGNHLDIEGEGSPDGYSFDYFNRNHYEKRTVNVEELNELMTVEFSPQLKQGILTSNSHSSQRN